MSKDKTGKFHPGKGKPSGVNKEEGLGIQPTSPENMEQYNEFTEKYTKDADELAPDVHLRHPNRNTSKGEDTFKGKENKPASDKTINDTSMDEHSKIIAEELPGVLTKEIFKELATYQSSCCISIFLGSQNDGAEVNKHYNVVSFKNGLQKVAGILKEKNIDTTEIESLLQPGYELITEDDFWLQQSRGLAFFISKGYFKYIKMPVSTSDDVIIEDTFYVTPLIPIIISNEYFYLMVISKKQNKLFRGDAFGMQYIPVEGLPKGLGEEFGDTDVATTFRAGSGSAVSGANIHGAGGSNNNDDKVYIANYLETADDVIWKKVLHNENAPLLLAGVEYLIPIYRSVCDYKYVWEDALTGSHEHSDTATLYKQAREKMEPYFQKRVIKALENFGNQSATSLTSSKIDEVVPATYYGRVSNLFVQKGEHIWGTFDEMENKTNFSDQHSNGAQDLVDNAVVKTLLNGGEVFLLDQDAMPAKSPLAAIFRY